MRIVPFPGGSESAADEAWHAELEAALSGEATGPLAESWRELRTDVRALAPPMTPEFERRLGERIAQRGAHRGGRRLGARARPRLDVAGVHRQPAAPDPPGRRRTYRLPLRRLSRLRLRPAVLLGGVSALTGVGAVIAALIIAGPLGTGGNTGVAHPASAASRRAVPEIGVARAPAAPEATNGDAKGAAVQPAVAEPAGTSSARERVQQLAASITLAVTSTEVQSTADRASQLAVSEGGYVQSSHVQVQQAGPSEATLTLRLPSAKLSVGVASLGRLAPVRAESQSLQDITGTYDAARRRVADADAERQALLRALSRASTQGQIDSLRERLSQVGGVINQARSALQAVSQRAATAEVEVTVAGDARTGSEGLSLHRGLHDASRVLIVTLVVVLIAAAVLVPLALLLAAFVAARRTWLRYRRERALDAP
jgi:hypothetical protein